MTLGKKVARRHLALAADLLALRLKLLPALLAIESKLVAVRLAGVDTLDAVRTNPLPFDDPLGANLLPLYACLTLDTLRTRLVTLHPRLSLDTLRTLAFHSGLALDTLRTLTFSALRTLAFGALERREMLLALHPRRSLASAATAARGPLGMLSAAAACLGRGLTILAVSMRPRIRRGCDRQRGYAGSEKNPGHHKSPSNGKTVRSLHRSNR